MPILEGVASIHRKAGVSRIYCNIHPQMAAYAVAVDSPFFAVSRRDGSFTLAAVPSGTHTYHAWRAGANRLTGTSNCHQRRYPMRGSWEKSARLIGLSRFRKGANDV